MPQSIILASISPYRRQQLSQLGLTFAHQSPQIDEQALEHETPRALALRLSEAKARAVAQAHPGALVIGSDQTGEMDGALLGKPHTQNNAMEQLLRCSGKTVLFHTGVCLISESGADCEVITTRVRFRDLSERQIRHYVERESPLDCAGSFKCEGLGIALFKAIVSDDPSALIGLPLITLNHMLYRAGLDTLVQRS